MIPALWRLLWELLWRGAGLRYLWRFLFGSWLVRRIWGDEESKGEGARQGDDEPTDGF